jgi:hypothetical protein
MFLFLVPVIMCVLSALVRADEDRYARSLPPYVKPLTLVDGTIRNKTERKTIPVYGCCLHKKSTPEGKKTDEIKEYCNEDELFPTEIGSIPQMTSEDALSMLQSAKLAWNGGENGRRERCVLQLSSHHPERNILPVVVFYAPPINLLFLR